MSESHRSLALESLLCKQKQFCLRGVLLLAQKAQLLCGRMPGHSLGSRCRAIESFVASNHVIQGDPISLGLLTGFRECVSDLHRKESSLAQQCRLAKQSYNKMECMSYAHGRQMWCETVSRRACVVSARVRWAENAAPAAWPMVQFPAISNNVQFPAIS